jgi:hypothetical protein
MPDSRTDQRQLSMRQSESWAPADVVIGRVDRQARSDQREMPDKIEPALAAEPIEKTEASEAAENADAREPTDPTDRIEPAEPIDRMEPEEPIDRIDPLDPILKMEPEALSERDELTGTCIRTFSHQRLPVRRIRPGRRHLAHPPGWPHVRSAANEDVCTRWSA